MSQHTPLPWRHGGPEPRRPWADSITIGDGIDDYRTIAQVYGIPTNYTVSQAEIWSSQDKNCAEAMDNARLIVRAVNCHADLLAACRAALAHLTDDSVRMITAMEMLRAAIERATKETP